MGMTSIKGLAQLHTTCRANSRHTGHEHANLQAIRWILHPMWTLPLATAGSIYLHLRLASSVDWAWKCWEWMTDDWPVARQSLQMRSCSAWPLRFEVAGSKQKSQRASPSFGTRKAPSGDARIAGAVAATGTGTCRQSHGTRQSRSVRLSGFTFLNNHTRTQRIRPADVNSQHFSNQTSCIVNCYCKCGRCDGLKSAVFDGWGFPEQWWQRRH